MERGWRGAGEGGPQGAEAGGAGWRGGMFGLVSGLSGGLAEGFGYYFCIVKDEGLLHELLVMKYLQFLFILALRV